MGVKTFLFHTFAFGFFTYVSYQVQLNKKVSNDPTVRNMQRFSLRFLTNWTFMAQMLYFCMCFLGHIIGLVSSDLGSKIAKRCNSLAISITAPMSVLVSTVFWSIYAVDRELVFPKALDEVLPPSINHSIHTFNCLLSLVNIWVVRHYYPTSVAGPIKLLLAYLLAYSVCLFGTYFQTGVWLYPFLGLLTWPQIGVATLMTLMVALSCFFLVKLVVTSIWGTSEGSLKKYTKKKK